MDTQYLITSVTAGAGCRVNEDVLTVAMPAAEAAIRDAISAGKEPPALEFALATAVQALRAACHQQHRGQMDLLEYCRQKLAKTDSLLSKLLGRKSKVQESIAELEAYEADINAARAGLSASQQKVSELSESIASTEAELNNHTSEAIEASLSDAATIWHLRERTNHHGSIVDRALFHAAHAEAITRLLHMRLVWLKDKLTAEQVQVAEFTKRLKALEQAK
jgi:DNA repair ATPase RecN